jgi:hypothetical protein
MKTHLAPFAALLFVTACASTNTTNAPPGAGTHLSAAQQDEVAKVEDKQAAEHRAKFDPKAVALRENCTPGGPGQRNTDGLGECWTSRINPTDAQLEEARVHERNAAQHRAASQALRDAEARACAGVSEHDRDVSPFAHRSDILRVTQTPKGAIVVFQKLPTMTAAGLQKVVDCHLARNDALAHNVPWMLYCPLVPRDVSAKVTELPDGFAVDIQTPDADAVREVKYRVGELITPH